MRWLFRFGLVVLLCVAIPGSASAKPKLEITDSRLVLSETIYQGNQVQVVFEIQNRGNSDLVIKKVAPG